VAALERYEFGHPFHELDHDRQSGSAGSSGTGRGFVHHDDDEQVTMSLIWGLITLLVVFWVLGFALHVGGSLIHLLLVLAIIVFVYNLITGRGARV
jgi:hypothetical protein